MTQIDYIIERARRELSPNLRQTPWAFIDHGRKLLSSVDEMNAYICAYGEMHKIKCLTALQNFPYDALPGRIEIVDWGCGQGIGVLCMLDNLYARYLLGRVRKITLIEPSSTALCRAKENVVNALKGWNIEVIALQKFLPGRDNASSALSDLQLTAPGTIHLFSNILDIISVDLKKTASIIEKSKGEHFVVCVGPVNANCGRIDEFSEYFSNTSIFSDIIDPYFGITTDTCHPFSCKTKGFYFSSATSSLSASVVEGSYAEEGAYDDYDLDAMVRNGLVSAGVLKVYKHLSKLLSSKDKIYLQPSINGDRPDIVIVRPWKGILLLDVFDDDIMKYTYKNASLESDSKAVESPLTRVYSYRSNIFEQHSSLLLSSAFHQKGAWYTVRPAVWFTNNSRINVDSTFSSIKRNPKEANDHIISGVTTLTKEDFSSNNIWGTVDLQRNRSAFTQEACSEFLKLLSSQWHSFNEGNAEIKLTKRQAELAQSSPGRIIRVRGVAGSGKTQVLASAAVKSQLRTGHRVLVLTYNVTLSNYIRYRISRIPADFAWNRFLITNYHSFFTAQAKNLGLKLDLASYNDRSFFESMKGKIQKYSAILIDEAQDYQPGWFSMLYDFFLEEDGEFVIFGDEKQDVYGRHSLGVIPELGGHTWGRWNELKMGHRITNQTVYDLAFSFQKQFFNNPDTFENPDREIAFNAPPRYDFISPSASCCDIIDRIQSYISSDSIQSSNTVILAPTIDILRELDYCYRQATGQKTITTIESKEDYDQLLKDEGGSKTPHFIEDIEAMRSNKKTHFTMQSPLLKFSTIYSYKGWEADNVFLVIQDVLDKDSPINRPELIYTAITRARQNLYIINWGNRKYHDFFQTQL